MVEGDSYVCVLHSGIRVCDPHPIDLRINFSYDVKFKLHCLYTQGIVIDPKLTEWDCAEEWHQLLREMPEHKYFYSLSSLP
jgi:hypothetical protein